MSEQFIDVVHDLTEEELAGIAADMTQRVLKIADLEDEKKEAAKEFGDKIKDEEAELLRLAELYHAGFEIMPILARLELDKEARMRQWVDVSTGAVVKEEAFEPEDYQETLPLDKPPTPEIEVTQQGLPLDEDDTPPLFSFKDQHERVLNMVRNFEGEGAMSFRTNTKKIRQAAEELIQLGYLTGEDFNNVTGLTKEGEELFSSGRIMSIPF